MKIRRELLCSVALSLSAGVLVGCDGKSDVVAEVVPFDRICSQEKWKNVALEGYFSIRRVSCRGMKSKKTGRTLTQECSVTMYATPSEAGPPVLVWLDGIDGDEKFNKIVPPPRNFGAEDFKVYDNDQKLIPVGNKVRVTGSLRKTDDCQMSVVRLDVVP